MSDTTTFGLPEAAQRLGVPVRVLRQAMRSGKVPAAGHVSATMMLSGAWLESAEAAVEASPTALRRGASTKVPAFARYPGTSAWRKYPNRVREYAHFLSLVK